MTKDLVMSRGRLNPYHLESFMINPQTLYLHLFTEKIKIQTLCLRRKRMNY